MSLKCFNCARNMFLAFLYIDESRHQMKLVTVSGGNGRTVMRIYRRLGPKRSSSFPVRCAQQSFFSRVHQDQNVSHHKPRGFYSFTVGALSHHFCFLWISNVHVCVFYFHSLSYFVIESCRL